MLLFGGGVKSTFTSSSILFKIFKIPGIISYITPRIKILKTIKKIGKFCTFVKVKSNRGVVQKREVNTFSLLLFIVPQDSSHHLFFKR